ncbi:hypothetical protein ACOMHN_022728 [Nucella lapillus]
MAGCNVDRTLRALGGRGRYQLLQVLIINLGAWGAAFQLFDNIFIGRKVMWHQCSPPRSLDDHRKAASLQGSPINWTSKAEVTYGQCQITVHRDYQHQVTTYPCLFGYDYDYLRELSFRTEFDLVCERALLGEFLQTLVILGQGCGAFLASFLSDRYGRKRVLVYSQFGLFGVGMAIGVAPTYTAMAVLKFVVGCFQQGVVTGKATMSIELFPSEQRSVSVIAMAGMWVIGNSLMALSAYILQHSSWRSLQCSLSAVSLLAALVQLGFTCAFCNFTLVVMSSSLHGSRFLNFFLIVVSELPACVLFYCIVDRQQALGLASSAGRLGGMMAPFMVPLSEAVVWLPGTITGVLCFVVIFLFRFLPETQGRELPQTLEDIDSWDVSDNSSSALPSMGCGSDRLCRRWWIPAKKVVRSVQALVFDRPKATTPPREL